jgi:hypothetical protein
MADESEEYYSAYERRGETVPVYEERRTYASTYAEPQYAPRRGVRGWFVALVIVAIIAVIAVLIVVGVIVWNAHQQTKSPLDGPCASSSQCDPSLVCTNGACKGGPNSSCNFAADCAGVTACVNGRCAT